MSLWNISTTLSLWLRQAIAHLLSAGATSLIAWPIESAYDQIRADLREARYPVEGTVVVDGRPQAGVELVVYRREAARWRPVASAVTKEGGVFSFALASGRQEYVATATYRPRGFEGEALHFESSATAAHHLHPFTSPLTFHVSPGLNRLIAWSLPLESQRVPRLTE